MHDAASAWRIAVPALLLGMVAGFSTTRWWIRRGTTAGGPGPASLESPSPVPRASLPDTVLRSIRTCVLDLVAHAGDRRRLRTGLGFEGPYLMSTDLTTRLISSEIDDFRQADSAWTAVKKGLEVSELRLADQALLSMLLAHRYLSLTSLVAFKRSAPGWLEGPELGGERAGFFEREIQETQGARAMQCLGESLDVALAVYTGRPGDPREATAAVETLLLFFDVSRAVATHEWTPGYQARVDQLQQRVEGTLGARASTGEEPGASISRLGWIAWRSGRSDLTGDQPDLKVELRDTVDRLRTAGVSLPEARFRALFPYAYPGTERAVPGPDLPYPPRDSGHSVEGGKGKSGP